MSFCFKSYVSQHSSIFQEFLYILMSKYEDFFIGNRGRAKIICTNIFNCSASNTHSTCLGHAKKLFIRKFPLK